MPTALDTIHQVALAQADVAMRPGLVLFVRGPLRPHAAALDAFWQRLSGTRAGARLAVMRTRSTSHQWANIVDTDASLPFSARFGFGTAPPGGWSLELADAPLPRDTAQTAARVHLQVEDRATLLGQERASSIRVLFDASVASAEIAQLGDWAIHHLPLWWGTAGWVFDHAALHPQIACARIASLAKRYWGVQLLDDAALQWDALAGMPSVNWLTLVGNAFAESRGWTADALASDPAELAAEQVFVRRGTQGVAIAAGTRPVPGDINLHEDFSPYVHAARRLAPLRLAEHRPLTGPLAVPDVLAAWLGRFTAPQPWLEADLNVA